jgi:cobalt-precorrin-5B (C1)-methyltransferase
MNKAEIKTLRTGFTTGACAAAAAKAAWTLFNGEEVNDEISIIFPDKKKHSLPIKNTEMNDKAKTATASVIKDAGDDPDVTHKALITVEISPLPARNITTRDFTVDILNSAFVIRGGKGVGLVTRKGLPVPEGKWAINPVPRKMLAENLIACKYKTSGLFLLEISVKNGEKIAKRTLNPTLGVAGGISILGTSGIVVPYSNKAYINTVKILLKGAKMEGIRHIALCTGGTTAKALGKLYTEIPELGIIRIGDFINPALKSASSLGFDKITVACMPGKLLKYAEGHKNTHAHKVKQQFGGLAKFAESLGFSGQTVEKIRGSATVREILDFIKPDPALKMVNELAGKALGNFLNWTDSSNIEVVVFDSDGKTVVRKTKI